MKYFITYGNDKYKRQKVELTKLAQKSNWFDKCENYGPDNLDDKFKEDFKYILSTERGGGHWIWKPYIIKKKLDEINDNDILIYLDSGCLINLEGKKRFDEYIDIVNKSKHGILSFELYSRWGNNIPLLEENWTGDTLLNHLKVTDKNKIAKTPQLVGGIIVMRKCENVLKIFGKALEVLYDKPDDETNFYIRMRRQDQSILSVIRKIYGTKLLKDETFFATDDPVTPLGWNDPIAKQFPFHARRIRYWFNYDN